MRPNILRRARWVVKDSRVDLALLRAVPFCRSTRSLFKLLSFGIGRDRRRIVPGKQLELCDHKLVRETWPVELLHETAMTAVAGAQHRQQWRPRQTREVGGRNHRIVLGE